MKRRTWLLAALLAMLWATPAKADNRIIVRTTLGLQGLQQLCGLPLLGNCAVVRGLGDPLNQLFLLTTPLDATTLLNLLRPLPGIVDVELDQLFSLLGGLSAVPTPLPAALMSDRTPVTYCGSTAWNAYVNQPAATIVRVPDAQKQFCGAGIVADIDTGVDPDHPAFAGVILQGYDFTRNQPGASELNDLTASDFPTYPPPSCNSSTCPSPAIVNQSSAAILDQSSAAILDQNPKYAAFGHGTMVMGVIHLVAPKVNLLPLKAFHSDGTGFLSDIVRAIYYATQNGANVINMSFEFTTNSPELASALDHAGQSALISTASAGNDGQKKIVYPAALQSAVMGVASTNDLDMRSSFSNYGNAVVWVAAPGEGIVTTYPFSTYAAGWGTSFSAPFVSGGSALLLNEQAKTNESQAAAAVAHAVPVGPDMGNGRLDLVQALQALSPADFSLSPSPTTTTINAGQSATYTVTLTPSGGFNQAVTLSCNGFPAASTCVITPPAVTLDGANPMTATVTVQTTARALMVPAASMRMVPLPRERVAALVWFLACGVVWLLVSATLGHLGRASRQRPGLAAALGLLAVSLCSNSCGVKDTVPPQPPGSATLTSLTLSPSSVTGGNPSTGKVTLSGPAPGGGTVVSLSSSNTSMATVPASVTVAAGTASATFQITTMAVANSTPVIISASQAGVSQQQTASLTVTPAASSGPTLTSLTLNPTSVNGGNPSTGKVILSGPAPGGGTVVSLSSSNTSVATVPASVTVAAGTAIATFQITTTVVANSTPVTISASQAGISQQQTATLTVTPVPLPGPTLTSLTLNPSSVIGGSPSTGTVTLSAPAPNGGAVVSLSSSNPAVATLPPNATIPAGATSATFTVSTRVVTTSTPITVSASYAGVTHTDSLAVTPAPPPGTPAGTYILTIAGTAGNLSHKTTVSLVVN